MLQKTQGRRFLCLCTFILSLTNISSAQTNVSGGVYSNTTWNIAGSPYIITGDVVIFGGITVTIQPGVVVKFNNNVNIDVRGNLYANGTPTDSIVFTSNAASPHAGIYSGINGGSSYRYCRFSYADTAISYGITTPISHCSFISNYMGVLAERGNSFDTCTFKHDSIGIAPQYASLVTRCEFRNNYKAIGGMVGTIDSILNSTFLNNYIGIMNVIGSGTIANCIFDSNKVYGIYNAERNITYCTIKYNGTGISAEESVITSNNISNNGVGINDISSSTIELNTISDNTIGIMATSDKISCNTICNNAKYNVEAEMSNSDVAENNYWCLSDSAAIQATIYDGHQNLSLGLAFFIPFDTAPCMQIPTAVKEISPSFEEIKLYPNPNNGSFTIQLSGISSPSSIEIYNMLGEKVYTSTIVQFSSLIVLYNSSPGVYLYRIISEKGNALGDGKFVVK